MKYLDEYFVTNPDELCLVICPHCVHKFKVQGCNIHRHFTCVKCGSEWYGERQHD